MRLPISYDKPYDLAKAVCKELLRRELKCPEVELLNSIFETLFFASLKTEESHEITCHIVYLNPKNPDPNPHKYRSQDMWSYVPLTKKVPFTVSNLVKIAQASDPRTSSFVIFPNKVDQLFIWGFIDQGNRYFEHLNYNSTAKPDRPGLFQTSILGKGHLVVSLAYTKIAELKTEKIIYRSNDVLRKGPIHKQLKVEIDKFTNSVMNELPFEIGEFRENWSSLLHDEWISTLCRLLLRTQSYHHGGAFLITLNNLGTGLNIKYDLDYSRIRVALQRRSVINFKKIHLINEILDKENNKINQISPEQFIDKNTFDQEYDECSSELDGCIWFVSLLSRVDGLVLLNPDLSIRGFGVEITEKDDPGNIFKATGPFGKTLIPVDYHDYGTRHRSMMRYCSKVENSIGFVCSQDGDIRVFTKLNDRVVFWENIRLQLDDFIDSRSISYSSPLRNKELRN